MMQQTIIWGISADDWRTISIVAQGVLMIFLVVTGIYQLMAIRKQAKRSATLETFTQWSRDAVLYNCLSKLHEARVNGDFDKNPMKYRPEIQQVLNELDVTAIGIEEGIYDEKLMYKYFKWVVRALVQRYLTGNTPQKINIALSSYENILDMKTFLHLIANGVTPEHRFRKMKNGTGKIQYEAK